LCWGRACANMILKQFLSFFSSSFFLLQALKQANFPCKIISGLCLVLVTKILGKVEHLALQKIVKNSGPASPELVVWDMNVFPTNLLRVSLIIYTKRVNETISTYVHLGTGKMWVG